VKGRELQFLLVKAEESQGWWNMLLADKNAYKGRCKIDWDLWRDEDDEGDEKDVGDFGAGGTGGGMPGMPGRVNRTSTEHMRRMRRRLSCNAAV